MAFPSVTYTFARSNGNDPTQLNRNFQDIINALTDGTKTLNVAGITGSALSVSGLVASQAVFTNASAALVSKAVSGTGSVILSNGPTFDGDVNISRSEAAGTVGLLLKNTSATATSPAVMTIEGTNGSGHVYFKSAFATWSQGWSMGAEPSNAAFVLDPAAVITSATPMIKITRGGLGSSTVNWDIAQGSGGADKSFKVRNTSNTASSGSLFLSEVAGTSAGDARFQWAISGGRVFTAGIDNSETGDPWVLSASAALGTSDVMYVASNGFVSMGNGISGFASQGFVYRANLGSNTTISGTFENASSSGTDENMIVECKASSGSPAFFLTRGNNEWMMRNPRGTAAFEIAYDATGSRGLTAGTVFVTISTVGDINFAGHVGMAEAKNIAFGTTTGTMIGTLATQKIGLFGVTPIIQPAHADQAVVTLGNTDNEIGGLTISATYDQAEVQALRDKCEELADDLRNHSTLLHAMRTAMVNFGSMKGSA